MGGNAVPSFEEMSQENNTKVAETAKIVESQKPAETNTVTEQVAKEEK